MNLGQVGIIETGGGFTGSFGAGGLEAIFDKGISPYCMQGTSVGSLTICKTAETDSPKNAKKSWLEIEVKRAKFIFDWKNLVTTVPLQKNALYYNTGLKSLIDNIDVRPIIDSKRKIQIVTKNESRDWEQTVFYNHDPRFKENPELFRKVILASTAIPGFLPPVEIENEIHSDGIHFCLESMISEGCDTIFILLNDQADEVSRWDQRLVYLSHLLYEETMISRLEKALQKHPDYYFLEDGNLGIDAKPPHLVKRIREQFKNIVKDLAQGIDPDLTPHRIIVINTRMPIPSLHTTGFEIGDIRAMYIQGYDQTKQLLDRLMPDKPEK